MDGRRNFLKTAIATCSLLAGSRLLSACTPLKKKTSEEDTFETFATPNALKGMPMSFKSSRASSSVFAVVTTTMFIPRSLSILSYSISGKMSCSFKPIA